MLNADVFAYKAKLVPPKLVVTLPIKSLTVGHISEDVREFPRAKGAQTLYKACLLGTLKAGSAHTHSYTHKHLVYKKKLPFKSSKMPQFNYLATHLPIVVSQFSMCPADIIHEGPYSVMNDRRHSAHKDIGASR